MPVLHLSLSLKTLVLAVLCLVRRAFCNDASFKSVSLSPFDMIAVDVRLCDSTSSDLIHEKQTEVVLVLPPRSTDKPARCLPNLPIFIPVVTLVQV
jgi:hypothetical protein